MHFYIPNTRILSPLMCAGTGEKSASESPEEAKARRLFEQLETGANRCLELWMKAFRIIAQRCDRVACALMRRRRASARALDSDPRAFAARAARILSGPQIFLFPIPSHQCPLLIQ